MFHQIVQRKKRNSQADSFTNIVEGERKPRPDFNIDFTNTYSRTTSTRDLPAIPISKMPPESTDTANANKYEAKRKDLQQQTSGYQERNKEAVAKTCNLSEHKNHTASCHIQLSRDEGLLSERRMSTSNKSESLSKTASESTSTLSSGHDCSQVLHAAFAPASLRAKLGQEAKFKNNSPFDTLPADGFSSQVAFVDETTNIDRRWDCDMKNLECPTYSRSATVKDWFSSQPKTNQSKNPRKRKHQPVADISFTAEHLSHLAISPDPKKLKASQSIAALSVSSSQVDEVNREHQPQIRSAQILPIKEEHGKDIDLFGEIVTDEQALSQEMKQREEVVHSYQQERVAARRRNALILENRETRRLEKQRNDAEITERQRLLTEAEEARKRTLRERERKKTELMEAATRDMKRSLAVERIINKRLMEDLERQRRASKDLEERARMSTDSLAVMRTRREEMRVQAACLKVKKPPAKILQEHDNILLADP